MINIPHFRQTPGLCGPASLKMLLEYYGKIFTESELTDLCGATVERGADHEQMLTAVRRIGEEPIDKEDATFDDIRNYVDKGIPVILGWWSEDDDHYSVVCDIDDETITMMDPQLDEGLLVMPLAEFDKIWYDMEGDDRRRVDHWMLVIPSIGT